MANCDFTVKIAKEDKPLVIKTKTDIGCSSVDSQNPLTIKDASTGGSSIRTLNDVDTTSSTANGTILVWDNDLNIWVQKFLDASNITNLSEIIGDYLLLTGGTVSGNLHVTQNFTVNNNFVSTNNNFWDLGSSNNYWKSLFVTDIKSANTISAANINVSYANTTNLYAVDVDVTANLDATTINAGDINVTYANTTNLYAVDLDVTNIDAGDINVTNANTTNLYAVDVDVTANLNATTVNATDVNITNNLTVDGDIILRGDTINLGDGGDVININASVNAHFVSTTDSTFDIGTSSTRWRNVYANYYYGDGTYLTISKHQTQDAPAFLANGQLHYSFSSDKLYIGQTDTATDTVSVEYIGGKLLVDKVANLESIVASISGDAATFSNTVVSGILTLSGYPENAVLQTKAGGVVEAVTGTYGEVYQIAANGTPYFDSLLDGGDF